MATRTAGVQREYLCGAASNDLAEIVAFMIDVKRGLSKANRWYGQVKAARNVRWRHPIRSFL